MQPLVSVVIPAYNAQSTLAETLRSLLSQSLTDWQAIIVDDGSTDSTTTIASDFAWRDSRITHRRQANRGPAAARNVGLDAATGKYIHFLDADDWLVSLGLERLVQAAEWSGRGAACGDWSLHAGDGRSLGVTMSPPDQVVGLEHLLRGNVLAPHSHIVRRDLIGALRFEPSMPVAEDYQMWNTLAANGVLWSTVDEIVAGYRIRPGSISKFPGRMLENVCRVFRRLHTGDSYAAAIRETALLYTAMSAITDRSPGFLNSHTMLRNALPGPAAFTAEELATAAYWALLFRFGIGPNQYAGTASRWMPRLTAWWESLTGQPAGHEVFEALALLAVSSENVAEAMLDRVSGDGPIVLAGAMGRNGRALRRIANARGIPLDLRDDRLPRAGLERLIDANSTILVAPTDDEPILAKLPRGVRIRRWNVTQRTLSGQIRDTLLAAHDQYVPAIGA